MNRRAFLRGSLLVIPAVGVAALASKAFDDVPDLVLKSSAVGHGMSILNPDAETSLRIFGRNIHSPSFIIDADGDIHHG